MSRKIKIHNTDIEVELTDPTAIWFYDLSLKSAEERGQILRAKLTEQGTIYYTSGELNVERAARFLYEMLKEQGKI
ncbi:hypothetical protein QH639_14795 [Lysinibacillus sp. 1 U-2021]|uniref:hypothetical protein n=1 Tax=Lysinibacillus sp. 1 U-2021 TaxID=3039426 RepID=UPI0024801B64|nr:hypothetical protein [Lysinibacillus sp. 1 U-2021]WGT37113.1 hypothetical protein QH639_14795 [Lysinibacillus sp. 1 U-2021]